MDRDKLREHLDADNLVKRKRLDMQKEVVLNMLMVSIKSEIMTRAFVMWSKCVAISRLYAEKSRAVKDAEEKLSAEARARRIAEAEARRAAELQQRNQMRDDSRSPSPRRSAEFDEATRATARRPHTPGGQQGLMPSLDCPRPMSWVGMPAASQADMCGQMAAALWRVARRRVAGGLVALMSNEGIPDRTTVRTMDLRPGAPQPGAAWEWRPQGGITDRTSPRTPRPAPAALDNTAWQPLGPSSAAAVSSTLDRLARARELIAAGARDVEERDVRSPMRSLSPVLVKGSRSASPIRAQLDTTSYASTYRVGAEARRGGLFSDIDTNLDGNISRAEWNRAPRIDGGEDPRGGVFSQFDKNADGVITSAEWNRGPRIDVDGEAFSSSQAAYSTQAFSASQAAYSTLPRPDYDHSPRTLGRSTVADKAALQAQISELQKYMDRVQEKY